MTKAKKNPWIPENSGGAENGAEGGQEETGAEEKLVAKVESADTPNETAEDLGAEGTQREGPIVSDEVLVLVPTPFTLNLTHTKKVSYETGQQLMPRNHAEHGWARLHGVNIINQ
jgi:hypothetical protein